MEKQLCTQCFGEKKFMTEKEPGKKKGLIYKDCNMCDDEGMIIVDETFLEDTELDY